MVFGSQCRPRRGAGAGFRDYKNSFGSICVAASRCGRVQAEFTSTRRWALALRPEHHPRSDQSGHIEQPACRTRCPKEPHAQRSWHLQRSPPAQSEDLPPEVWLPTLSVPTTSGSSTVIRRAIAAACSSTSVGGRNSKHVAEVGGRHCRRTSGPHTVLEHIKLKSIRDPTSVIKPLVLSDITELRNPRRVTAAVATALAATEAAVTGLAATGSAAVMGAG